MAMLTRLQSIAAKRSTKYAPFYENRIRTVVTTLDGTVVSTTNVNQRRLRIVTDTVYPFMSAAVANALAAELNGNSTATVSQKAESVEVYPDIHEVRLTTDDFSAAWVTV